MNTHIRLAGVLPDSLVNGEGLRHVLFAQICHHNCCGCFNPETHSPDGGELIPIAAIVKTINDNPLLSGVTFSGGDPFEQAEEFAIIAKAIKKNSFDIWCYTGYTYEYLMLHQDANPGWGNLLDRIDVLVDGPYIEALADPNLKYRGSSNQRIIDLKATMEAGSIIQKSY
ncbi:MAG: anaerobic ribonucleoside-triphosphate reductase activating protein [Cellulosilyticaceae bacterium]